MLMRIVCLLVLVAVVLFEVDAKAGDRNKRSYDSAYCNETKLGDKTGSKGKGKTKAEYERAEKQWHQLEKDNATIKAEIKKKIAEEKVNELTAANFAKIPMSCLRRLPLDGVTVEQTVAVAKLGDSLMVKDMLAKLATAKKTEFLTEALKADNTDKIPDNIKVLIGNALLTDVITKKDTVSCAYLVGALSNPSVTRDNLKAITAKICDWNNEGIKKNMNKILELYKAEAKITTTADAMITELKPLLSMMDSKACKDLFKTTRLADALKTTASIKALDLTALDSSWKLDKCSKNGKKSSPCLQHLAKAIKPVMAKVDDTVWPTLGYVTAFLEYGTVNTFLKAKTDKCDKYKLYKMYDVRGWALPAPFKSLISSCTEATSKSTMSKVTDFTKETKINVMKYAGYIPFASITVINGIPKAILCDNDVFKVYKNYVQYGLAEPIKEKCDKELDVTAPVPEQESCLPKGKIAKKGKNRKRQERPAITTDTIRQMSKADSVKSIENADVRRTIERLPAPDRCFVVNQGFIEKAETLFAAAESPETAQCFKPDTIAEKMKTAANLKKMAKGRLNKAQQRAVFAEVIKKYKEKALPETELRDLGRVAPEAMEPWVVRAQTVEPFVLAKIFSTVFDRLPTNATEAILGVVNAALASEEEADPYKALTAEQAEQMDMLLAYIENPDLLKNAITDVKKAYCDRISRRMEPGVDERCRRLPDLKKVYSICKTAKGVPAKAKWTAEDVKALGQLAGMMAKPDITGMTKDEFMAALETFSGLSYISADAKSGFVEKVKAADVFGADSSKWTTENLAAIGAALRFLPKDLLEKIPRDALSKYDDPSVDLTCSQDKFGVEDTGYTELQKAEYKVLSATSAATRRKRSVQHTWTYAELSLRSDEFLNLLTIADYKAMPVNEIKPMHKRLGFVVWVDSTKAKELLKLVKDKIVNEADICKFTDLKLIDTGYLLLHMTVDEIKCMDLKASKATPLSTIIGWSKDQYKELATKMKKDRTLVTKDMDSPKIVAFGSFMCGLPTSEVEALKPAELKKELHITVQLYDECEREIWTALLKVLTHSDGFGPIKDWSNSTVLAVGSIIGGLTKEQIEAMGVKITVVPVDTLKKIDSEVLPYMTSAAKGAFDEETRKSLGLDVKASSAVAPVFSGSLLLLSLLVTFGFH